MANIFTSEITVFAKTMGDVTFHPVISPDDISSRHEEPPAVPTPLQEEADLVSMLWGFPVSFIASPPPTVEAGGVEAAKVGGLIPIPYQAFFFHPAPQRPVSILAALS